MNETPNVIVSNLASVLNTEFGDRFDAIRQLTALSPDERKGLQITQVNEGGFIRFENKTYRVDRKSRYLEKWKSQTWEWFELDLFEIQSGRTVFLEYEFDDNALLLTLTDQKLRMADMQDDKGRTLNADAINLIIENDSGRVVYNGEAYDFEESFKATYYARCSGNGENLEAVEFMNSKGHGVVCEQWSDRGDNDYDFAAWAYRVLRAKVEVISLGGDSQNDSSQT